MEGEGKDGLVIKFFVYYSVGYSFCRVCLLFLCLSYVFFIFV